MTSLTRRELGSMAIALGASAMTDTSASAEQSADDRARQIEQQMTDDERFTLVVSIMGANFVAPARDPRWPEGVPMSAG
jgi:hypothetical protein